jgi:phosphoribosylglycinamide formyltransferase-1
MKHLAIFASGTGSNAAKIVDYFDKVPDIKIALIVSNRADAGALDIGKAHNIPTKVINREDFYHSNQILFDLQDSNVHWIILAGFLWLVPSYLINSYPRRIINIHPALLPKYGGKGMYGIRVHEAVHKAEEPKSGISIHYVNERYDEGQIIFQATCDLSPEDQPEDIRRKVLKLEHQYFAPVIEKLIRKEKIQFSS